jgi:hypothetical protein
MQDLIRKYSLTIVVGAYSLVQYLFILFNHWIFQSPESYVEYIEIISLIQIYQNIISFSLSGYYQAHFQRFQQKTNDEIPLLFVLTPLTLASLVFPVAIFLHGGIEALLVVSTACFSSLFIIYSYHLFLSGLYVKLSVFAFVWLIIWLILIGTLRFSNCSVRNTFLSLDVIYALVTWLFVKLNRSNLGDLYKVVKFCFVSTILAFVSSYLINSDRVIWLDQMSTQFHTYYLTIIKFVLPILFLVNIFNIRWGTELYKYLKNEKVKLNYLLPVLFVLIVIIVFASALLFETELLNYPIQIVCLFSVYIALVLRSIYQGVLVYNEATKMYILAAVLGVVSHIVLRSYSVSWHIGYSVPIVLFTLPSIIYGFQKLRENVVQNQ